jgi:hypothetical protein
MAMRRLLSIETVIGIRAIAFLAVIVGCTGAARATTYDISTDFSTASNPNGVWTYGFSTTLGGTLTLYDQPTTDVSGIQNWRSSTVQSSLVPEDFNNPTGGAVTTCTGCIALPAHTAAFHPGQHGEFSAYRFTAPSAGIYLLSATFVGIDHGGTDVHILDNGTEIYSANIATQGDSSSHSETRTLLLGETIDFAVGVGIDGTYYYDSTSINGSLTLSAIPEPEIYALLMAGLGLVGFVARRRKKALSAA